jgi:DNA-binding beta-propeller fold protein YncE
MKWKGILCSILWLAGLCACVPGGGGGGANGNRPPRILGLHTAAIPGGGGGSGNMITHRVEVEAMDPDGDPLTYTYVGEDNTMLVSPNGMTAEVQIFMYRNSARVTVMVEDGKGNRASQNVDLLDDNHAPTITAFGAGKYRMRPGENTGLTAAITDADGDAVACNFWITSGAFRGTLDDIQLSSGNVCTATFTSTSSRNGLVTVLVEATDSHGGRSTGELVLRVARDFSVVGSLNTSPLEVYGLDYTADGRFIVSDFVNQVMVFHPAGSVLQSPQPIPDADSGQFYVRALAVDRTLPDEPLYIGSQNQHHREKVYVFDQDLAPQGEWSLPPNAVPHYLLVRPDGSVLISDEGFSRILIRKPDGTVETWAQGLNRPRQLARDPLTGNIYVINRENPRVSVLTKDGVLLKEWRGVDGDFSEPHGIAVDRRHEIVVVADTSNSRLQVFDLEGNYLLTWTSPEVNVPRYIIIGPDGLYHIASYQDQKVHLLDYQ